MKTAFMTQAMVACLCMTGLAMAEQKEQQILPSEVSSKPVSFVARAGEAGEFTWWLPSGAEEYVLPISMGWTGAAGGRRGFP
jgi:hypothetical protein